MEIENMNLCDLSDVDVAARMRKINYEKFKTLVRMHLSFELDLNTDEFDLPCHEIIYEDKGKLKKWNRLSKKHKFSSSSGTTLCTASNKDSFSAGNSPTETLHQQIDAGFLYHLKELKEFLLLEKNLIQEGIYRKTGSASRQNELRAKIQNEKPLELEESGYSAHDCTTVFKGYLAELPEPLLTDALYPAHLQIAPLCIGTTLSTSTMRPPNPERIKREQRLLNSIQLLLLLLPEENRHLLQHIIEMLHAVVAHEPINKMSPENLATLFAPHLICPRKLPPEALHYIAKKMSSIIAYMITRGMVVFEVPAKLATDIRAYFLERKRKKTMSPEQTLDDSISDISTVNTVYTFVDREKTAAAHTTNTTDTELAQLYAHIQSLPESSKKRRLIKQFNKQNGQGTPLQLVVLNRLKNSEASRSAKSISDSIKKHIFHKGIMSRTPKRQNAAMPVGVDTPNFSNTKNPKLRVLFQSPAPTYQNNCNTAAIVTSTVSSSASSITSLLSSSSSGSSASSATLSNACLTSNNTSLKKSLSSSSLLLNASAQHRHCSHINPDELDSCSSCSSDGLIDVRDTCVSAPISRQISNDSNDNCLPSTSNSAVTTFNAAHNLQKADGNYRTTPLKIISDAAKHILGTNTEKKTVAFDDHHLLSIIDHGDSFVHTPCTPIQKNSRDLKARFKSEPNLTRILKEKFVDQHQMPDTEDEITPISSKCCHKSLTRKLIKGVSMSNLRFPFSTPTETTKRLVRSVSSTLKHRPTNEDKFTYAIDGVTPLLEDVNDGDLDDETFEDNPNDDVGSSTNNSSNTDCSNHDDNDDEQPEQENVEFEQQQHKSQYVDNDAGGDSSSSSSSSSCSHSNEIPDCSMSRRSLLKQQSNIYRNMDLIVSTPSLLIGRRSMSPITKSAQRMPKAMQESIMTPRSRKPVMVLTTTTLSSTEQNQTVCQTDLSSCREQDEEDDTKAEDNAANAPDEGGGDGEGYSVMLRRQHSLQANQSLIQKGAIVAIPAVEEAQHNAQLDKENNIDDEEGKAHMNELTSHFKQYLLRRSVMTATPVDSSFASQPDDFGSPQEIQDFDESQLSPTLLYCLDGNQPDVSSNNVEEDKTTDCDQGQQQQQQGVTSPNQSGKTKDNIDAATTTSGTSSDTAATAAALSCITNQLATNPFIILNNARKRAATNDPTKIKCNSISNNNSNRLSSTTARRNTNTNERIENVDDYLLTKKLIISEYPGETSF